MLAYPLPQIAIPDVLVIDASSHPLSRSVQYTPGSVEQNIPSRRKS